MRFLFACGGTGGHINPAIAIAGIIKDKRKNAEILFVGIDGGMETKLVPAAGYEIKTISSGAISRKKGIKSLLGNVDSIRKVLKAEKKAGEIIKEFSPDVVIGTGGYACYPVLSAAVRLKIPTVVHEANAYPGLATRALAKRVTRVLLNFEASKKKLPKKVNSAVVGYPVRGDLLMYDREQARKELGIEKKLVVSFWGSLGAREMNRCIAEFIKLEVQNKSEFAHIHATGKFGYEWMPETVSRMGVNLEKEENITLREYIDDMPRVLAAADVVMCRGGAGTLAEISVRGTPSIIIPSPNVTDNHQFKNASELAKIGGAVVFEEKDITAKLLYDTVSEMLSDDTRRNSMSENLIKNSMPDSAEKIYEEIMKLCKR